ncbi:hypothetical protein Moror_2046 [Moniliophthora roreri MCA 2997]|uniref:Uncharacterized protein n=2 Tax=Moniliophthora roreri TaxID=221103 RepID=V2WKX1_MONRO|nr:hypothetical protein Moror_2046 [Moniliophthora roreri MCA 2997]
MIGPSDTPELASTAVQFFLYGEYTVLLGIAIHILRKRKGKSYQYNLFIIILLFLLASANVATYMVGYRLSYYGECIRADTPVPPSQAGYMYSCPSLNPVVKAQRELSFATSAVADFILATMALLHSCHFTAFAVAFSPVDAGNIVVVAAGAIGLNNLFLSGLIAFRICKINRGVAAYLGPRARNMYWTAKAATLESGLFYSAYLGVLAIIEIETVVAQEDYRNPLGTYTVADQSKLLALQDTRDAMLRLWAPIAGIASTIVIVRVALGISLNDTKSTILTMQAATSTIEEPALAINISQQDRMSRSLTGNRASDRDTSNTDVEARAEGI